MLQGLPGLVSLQVPDEVYSCPLEVTEGPAFFYSFKAPVLAEIPYTQAVEDTHDPWVYILGDRQQGDLFFFAPGLQGRCSNALPAALQVGSQPGLEAFGEVSN